MTDATMARRGDKLRVAAWGFAAALWLTPLVAMQFTREVDWDVFDFVVFGAMLLLALVAYEVVTRMSPNRSYRLGAGVAIVTGFLVVWANGAVGMIGNEGNAYNLWFPGAIGVGAAGALLAWFRPRGMAWSLYATAAIHAAAALVALAAGWDTRGAVFSLAFVFPWLLSAGLFRKAARDAGS